MKSREAKAKAKAKAEAKTVERARVWFKAKAKYKAGISRVNAEDIYIEEAEARLREETNYVQRSGAEASVNIIAKPESEREKRERAEAEARAKAEDNIK